MWSLLGTSESAYIDHPMFELQPPYSKVSVIDIELTRMGKLLIYLEN